MSGHKKQSACEKVLMVLILLLLPTNAEKAPEENVILWFSSDMC